MSTSERQLIPRRRRRRWPILPCLLVLIWAVLAAARNTPPPTLKSSTVSPEREATLSADIAVIAALGAKEREKQANEQTQDIREGHSANKAKENVAKAEIDAGVAMVAAAAAVNAAEKAHSNKENKNNEADKAAELAVLAAEEASRSAVNAEQELKEAEKEAGMESSGTVETTTPTLEVTSTKAPHLKESLPTFRPRRVNCTPPAIEQFPHPIMSRSARRHGGLIIHVLVAVYTFIGLAIVCDHYFVTSLDRICEELKLSPDVAGATFMAAGSSAPELATVIIGVFFAKDDIGVSGVIGSAVFNIMFVIAVCALCTSTVCYLNWWPLIRDCFFYSLAILIMLITIFDDMISWGEALFMLIVYVIYCITLHFNPRLEAWAQTLPVPCKRQPEEESALVTYKTLSDDKNRPTNYTDMNNSEGATQTTTTAPVPEPVVNFNAQQNQGWGDGWGDGFPAFPQEQPPAPVVQQEPPPPVASPPQRPPPPGPQQQIVAKPQQEIYKSKETNADEPSPLLRPTEGGKIALFKWYIVYPIHYVCTTTMPDCKTEKYRSLYPLTFVISMIWISFFSYIMVWMITIIGSTLSIPDTVMGLTFVAAGVSVPDALSSLAVVREGYGDMAVSNAVGSNVFDILICLGLPWFIQTAIIKPGSRVHVYSKGLTYSTLSLLSTVVFLVVATHLNGWKLDKKYGVILMIWYLLFITFASLYELNAFGFLNPEVCPSSY